VKRFAHFWLDFIVGDDWLAASLVVAAIAVTAWLAAWWVMPVAFAGILALSLRRATRRA
jgi:hypothetical protein